MKNILLLIAMLAITFFQCQPDKKFGLSKNEMLETVKELDAQFGIGVKAKDSALLVNIYTDSAQYVQPNRQILVGKTEIGKDWAGFIKMKENPVDIILKIKEVKGTKEIIYETGTGYTLLADSTRWNFNYVNIWLLQKDGGYKLDIDTYTSMDK